MSDGSAGGWGWTHAQTDGAGAAAAARAIAWPQGMWRRWWVKITTCQAGNSDPYIPVLVLPPMISKSAPSAFRGQGLHLRAFPIFEEIGMSRLAGLQGVDKVLASF